MLPRNCCALRPIARIGILHASRNPRIPLLRAHGSHSHHHRHDAHEPATREGTRVTLAGLALNIGLTVAKGAGGLAWHSSALIAEATHSLSDLTSDAVTLFAYKVARRGPTKTFPAGLAKLEPLGGAIVSGLLIAAGASIAGTSAEQLYTLFTSELPLPAPLPAFALYIMIGSVGLKEAMYQWTSRVAKRVNSTVLLANAWHHRLDAMSSSVALAAIFGAVEGWTWLDPVGGVLVAGMVIRAGWKAGRPAVLELLDAAPPSDLTESISTALTTTIAACEPADVVGFERLRVGKAGPFSAVDVSIRLRDPDNMSASRAQAVLLNLERALKSADPDVQDVTMRIASDKKQTSPPPLPAAPPAQ
ncbi:hypothetical protein HDU88_003263 [Geranomyces variabilis]|nr:hypothetical protein HDU88_003263 [Geranomyces variabilis]